MPKKRLLVKLKAHGVTGLALNWIRSWIGETQRVVLNDKASSWAKVLSGVPHGSVLGLILFSISINDLDKKMKALEIVRKFAHEAGTGSWHGHGRDKATGGTGCTGCLGGEVGHAVQRGEV